MLGHVDFPGSVVVTYVSSSNKSKSAAHESATSEGRHYRNHDELNDHKMHFSMMKVRKRITGYHSWKR